MSSGVPSSGVLQKKKIDREPLNLTIDEKLYA